MNGIGTTINEKLYFNSERSKQFIDERPLRHAHYQQHPTGLEGYYCMDSRGRLSEIFEGLPLGTMRVYQNVGGIFSKKWKRFCRSVEENRRFHVQRGWGTLKLCAAHYSKSDAKLGCKGHSCNRQRAFASAWKLKEEMDILFEHDPGVYSICIAVNTDDDSITFFNFADDDSFDVATAIDQPHSFIIAHLRRMYGFMPGEMFIDLVDLAIRNVQHVRSIMAQGRPVQELDHREQIIFVGQSPRAICDHREALVIGPFAQNFTNVVQAAGGIIKDNLRRYGLDGGKRFLLISAVPYHPQVNDEATEKHRRIALGRSQELADQAVDALDTGSSSIWRNFERLSGVTNMDTMRFEPFG